LVISCVELPSFIEGKIEERLKATVRLGRRREELIDDLKEKAYVGSWKR